MKFNLIKDFLEKNQSDCIVTTMFYPFRLSKSSEKIDKLSDGYIKDLLKVEELDGSFGQITMLHKIPNIFCNRILLIGFGKKNSINEYKYEKIIKQTIQFLIKTNIKKVTFCLNEINVKSIYNNYWKIRKTIEKINEELYFFNFFKKKRKPSIVLKKINFNIQSKTNFIEEKKSIKDGIIISKSIKKTKNLSNMPPNICNSTYLLKKVLKLKNNYENLVLEIINEEKMKKLKMNAYLSVGQGSKNESLMLIMKHKKKEFTKKPIILIGKGVTFDSGGISIKPSHKMNEMKYDMCGAAAIYGIFYFLCKMNLPIYVIGILACCENMPSSKSYRPGDIIKTMSGKTVEIINTDAEGRLVLCDVLTYVKKYNPEVVIDIATLTGACSVALGNSYSGLMSNNKRLAIELLKASKESGDKAWELPLNKEYYEKLKSNCADISNCGDSYGGAITAACFLEYFSKKYNWAHLDIAGTAWKSEKNCATGRPVSLIIQFLLNRLRIN